MYYATKNQFGLTFDQVRRLFPQTSFVLGAPCESADVKSYELTKTPDYNPLTHGVREAAPALIAGVWAQQWEFYLLPVPSLPDAKASLKDRATGLRWQHETGGITLPGGIQIATGTEDQNRITTVIANAQLAAVTSVDFKAASGWVTLTLPEVQGIAAAIALHVQACFSAERAHHEAIDSTTSLDALRAYDVTAGWPTQEIQEY